MQVCQETSKSIWMFRVPFAVGCCRNFSGLHSAGYNHNENLSNWSLSEIFEPNQYSNAQWLSQKMNLLFSNATVQKTLRYLILPFNNMTGNISTLEGLQSLQTLDLRNNKLFGNLDFLSRIRSLNSLNVSYNSKLSMTPFLFSKRFGSSRLV
jgi:Leucine-rich repeat (LRR) protein